MASARALRPLASRARAALAGLAARDGAGAARSLESGVPGCAIAAPKAGDGGVQLQQARPFAADVNPALLEVYNRQRQIVPINNLVPDVAVDAYVAPNAVLVGGVTVQDGASVGYGSVLRADLNYITIGAGSAILDKVIINPLPALASGLSAETKIGRQVVVGPNSVLSSCEVEDEVLIGQRCIVQEGAIIERSSVLEDASVVGPDQLIPSGEVWGGNPARFVRHLSADEKAAIPSVAAKLKVVADEHAAEFLPFSTAYIEKEHLLESLAKAKAQREKAAAAAAAKK